MNDERNERMVQIIKGAVLHRLPMKHGIQFQDENGTIRYPAAWAEDIARNAVQAMQGVLGACPRCSATLPQYEGLCAECARAGDHER